MTNKSQIKNPNVNRFKYILKEYVSEHYKQYSIYCVVCKIKTICNTFTLFNMYNLAITAQGTNSFIRKIAHKEANILEIDICFIAHYSNMTYEHYLSQPKSMVEWTLHKKIVDNSELKNYSNILKYIQCYDNIFDAFHNNKWIQQKMFT